MSATGPGTAGLPLFAATDTREEIKRVRVQAEVKHAEFFSRLRHLVGQMFAGQDITSDQVRWVMDRYGLGIPAGASPNIMGTFFTGWDRAEPVMGLEGKQRTRVTTRKEGRGNDLKVWLIKP